MSFLFSKSDLAKIRLKERLAQNPAKFYFFLKLKIFFFEFLISFIPLKKSFQIFKKFFRELGATLRKIFIILFFDPSKSFSVLINQSDYADCPYSYIEYKNYQKRVRAFSVAGTFAAIFALVLLINIFGFPWTKIKAASYAWSQTSWSGGITANTASHTSNQTGWTEYSATSSNIAVVNSGADLQLAQVASSTTQTTTADFNGTNTNTQAANNSVSLNSTDAYPSGVTVVEGLVMQDCTGQTNCFTSLAAWEAAYGGITSIYGWGACATGDLTCKNMIAAAKIDGAWTSADTAAVIIRDTWTTDATRYVKVYTTPSARHDGKWNTNKYRLETGTGAATLKVNTSYTIIDGLQIRNSGTASTDNVVELYGYMQAFTIKNNIIKNGYRGIQYGMLANGSNTYIYNNIIYGAYYTGIEFASSYTGSNFVYNNILYGNNTSSSDYGGGVNINSTVTLSNNILMGHPTGMLKKDIISGGGPESYNISSDTSAAGTGSLTSRIATTNTTPIAGFWVVFTNLTSGSEDFHLQNSSENDALNAGTDLSSVFKGDVDNGLRSGAWDIGADEYGTTQTLFTGNYESSTIDLTLPSNLSTLTWNATLPSQTGANALQVQLAVDAEGDGPWSYTGTDGTSGTYFTSSGSSTPSALNGYRYVRYKLYLQTADNAYTPSLDDITINYSQYPASQTLTSSAYDTNSAANMISKISWSTTTPTGTDVKFQIRTATTSADLSWHNWCGYEDTQSNGTTGANCSGNYYFTSTSSNVILPSSNTLRSSGATPSYQDDKWMQYKITLTSTGVNTPTVSDVTITYVVNSPPEFDATYGTRGISVSSQASDGTFSVSYKIRDQDTASSTNADPGSGYIIPSFEYSTNGGGSWATITGGLSSLATTSKAVNSDGVTWNTHTFTWTPTSTPSLSGTYTTQAQLRITLNDGEAANNTVSTTSAEFTLDAKNPAVSVNPRITATSTTPTLYFSASDDSNLQMRAGLNSDLSDNLNWVSYANSTTTSLATDPDTVYIQFRDVYDNRTSIYSVATPETPANFVVQDTSNTQTGEYRLFLAWKVYANSGNFGSYRVYKSADSGSTYSLLATITDRTTNYYLDQNLTASSTYYYKVASMDSSANGSYFSSAKQAVPNGAQDYNEGGGGNPADPPTISSVSSGTTTTQSTTITWTTDKLSNSTVQYCSPAPCTNYTLSQGVTSYVTSHSVVLRSLTPAATYSYKVVSADIYNNTASSTGYTFTTNSGPSISGVSITDITDVSAKITWNTNTAATGYVVYASSSPPSGYEAGWGTQSTARTVSLTGLTRGTKYWFYVKSQDADSNLAYDYNVVNGETRYFDFTTSQDSTAPTISNVNATSTTDTVSIIYWTTNEEATSQIEYGVSSGNYINISMLNSNLDNTHFLKLTGLAQNTVYYYRAGSADGSGNLASSTEQTFTTLSEQIARSRAGEYAGGGGVPQIIYLSEVEEKEKLQKKLEEFEKRPDIKKEDLEILKKDLEDLKFKSISKDLYDKLNEEYEKLKAELAKEKGGDGEEKDIEKGGSQKPEEIIKNLAIKFKEAVLNFSGALTVSETEELLNSTTESFEELIKIIPPPVMSAEPKIEIGSNYAVILWKTNKEANSIVAYAADSAYSPSQNLPYTTQIGNSEEFVKEHTVKLENLLPSTVYHYQIMSKAKLGDYAKSKDFTFITKAESPRISDASMQRMGLTDAKVNWRTFTLSDSLIKYTPVRNGGRIEKESKTEGDPNFVLFHELDLKNLEPDTGYFVEVFSKDSFGNIESKPLGSFFTSKDTSAPFISQVKIENSILPGQEGRVQTIISWKTDEPSTSQIAYEQGANFKETPRNLTSLDRNLTTTHTAVLTSFKAGILYRFRVLSRDQDGNEAQTKDYTVFTPQNAKGILEIILENFEQTFGWTKKLGF